MRLLTVRNITCVALVRRDEDRRTTSYDIIAANAPELPDEPESVATDTLMTVDSESDDDDDLLPVDSMRGVRMVLPYTREYTVVVRNLPLSTSTAREAAAAQELGVQVWVSGDPHRTVLAPRLIVPSVYMNASTREPCVDLTATAVPDAGAFMGYPTGVDDQRGKNDALLAAEVTELPTLDAHVSITV